MSRTIRFAYVQSPRGTVWHMSPGAVEGDITRCGLIQQKGWRFRKVNVEDYGKRRKLVRWPKITHRCANCQRAP